jgi:hypothetical protein
MLSDNPTVECAVHATRFVKTDEFIDFRANSVSQTWVAPCKCAIHITLVLPTAARL